VTIYFLIFDVLPGRSATVLEDDYPLGRTVVFVAMQRNLLLTHVMVTVDSAEAE
jgi:hypothetical protein